MDFVTLFKDATVAGIPLLAFVLAFVQWIKGFNLEANAIRASSMLVGLLIGIGYQFQVAPPMDFTSWFTAIVFGLALGLGASGIYDVVNKA